MIEINLLPQEIKIKNKGPAVKQGYLLYLLIFIFAGLICIHLGLAVLTLLRQNNLRLLENKWSQLVPQRKALDGSIGYSSAVDSQVLNKLFEQRVCWSGKLNKFSLNLPDGVWFNEITLKQDSFILKGAVISLTKVEMALINSFLDNLKNDNDFMRDFSILEIDSAQRKMIGGYEVVEFNLNGALR